MCAFHSDMKCSEGCPSDRPPYAIASLPRTSVRSALRIRCFACLSQLSEPNLICPLVQNARCKSGMSVVRSVQTSRPRPPRHRSHFGHSGLAFAFQFIRYVSCSAHLTTSRLISFANYHKAPRSYRSSLSCCFGVVSISLQLIQFRPPPRLFFLARKSQQMSNSNCHFFCDVLFSSRIQCIQRPLPPFLAKNERPRDGPTSLKLHSFYFWLWASPSFLPPFHFIHSPAPWTTQRRRPRSFVLFLNSFPPN